MASSRDLIGEWDFYSRLSLFPNPPPTRTLRVLLDELALKWKETGVTRFMVPESFQKDIERELIGVQSKAFLLAYKERAEELNRERVQKEKVQTELISAHCKNLHALLITLLQKLNTQLTEADYEYDPITRDTLNKAREDLKTRYYSELRKLLNALTDPDYNMKEMAARDFKRIITHDSNTRLLYYQVMSDTSLDQLTSINEEIEMLENTKLLIQKTEEELSLLTKRLEGIETACWARDQAIHMLPDVLRVFETQCQMRLL
jgi:hypothetical protein